VAQLSSVAIKVLSSHEDFFMRYVLKVMLCVSIFGSSTYTMQPEAAVGLLNSMNALYPGLASMVGVGAASGFVVPAVGSVCNIALGGQPFDKAIVCSTGAGSLFGTIFYVVSCPCITGRITGFIVPKFATLFTVALSLAIGTLTTFQSNRR
jgi:hypothetical protein